MLFDKKRLILLVSFVSLFKFSFSGLINLDKEKINIDLLNAVFLGSGAYKDVFSYQFTDFFDNELLDNELSGKKFAISCFKENAKGKKHFEHELDFYTKYEHPNLIKAFAYSREQKLIVTELAIGDLNSILGGQKQKIEFNKLLIWFLDIAKGLQYLHEQRIIHRDIKPANVVLVFDDNEKRAVAKIIDFDLSIVLPEGQDFIMKRGSLGTLGYKAIELMFPFSVKNKKSRGRFYRYSFAIDIYALGVLFFKFITKSNFYLLLLKWLNENVLPEDNQIHFKRLILPKIQPRGERQKEHFIEILRYKRNIEILIVNNYKGILSRISMFYLTLPDNYFDLEEDSKKSLRLKNSFFNLVFHMLNFDAEFRPSSESVIEKLQDLVDESEGIECIDIPILRFSSN